jgi:hypothetical protein
MVFNATFYNVLARSWQISFIGGGNSEKPPTCVYNHFHRYFSYIVVVSFIGGWSGGNHWPAASRPLYSTCLINAHGDVPLVVITSRSFNDSWFSTGFVTWLTRQVLIVQQELPTFQDIISSPHDLSGTYEFWLLLWYPQKLFVLTFIVTMDSGRIPAYFIYQLRIIVMQLVQEEGLVNLLLSYHVTSTVTFVDVLLWYHVTSGVALVDLLR